MGSLIARMKPTWDDDLILCEDNGVAYQTDNRAHRIEYGDDYLAKVDAYDGTPIATAVNAGRVAMLQRHLLPYSNVLDVGAGSGAFAREARKADFFAYGYEVIPQAVARLQTQGVYSDDPKGCDAVTFWDSLEHMEDPEVWLRKMVKGQKMFASIPVFENLRTIRLSRHYRPGEHLTYWTENGFIEWAALCGFRLLEESRHEIEAGRESIGAFAFQRIAA